MTISQATRERIDNATRQRERYTPNSRVLSELANKSLVMVVGPSAAGKSTVIDHLASTDDRFGKVRSFATRDPRPDDTPETMQTFERTDEAYAEILRAIETGDVVQYVPFPASGDIYGTFSDSYPGEYNLVPALSQSVAGFEALPFRSHHTVGLVTEPAYWGAWLESRAFDERTRNKRLAEATQSLEWLLGTSSASIVVNKPGIPSQAAEAIRDIALDDKHMRSEATAEALLREVRRIQEEGA